MSLLVEIHSLWKPYIINHINDLAMYGSNNIYLHSIRFYY